MDIKYVLLRSLIRKVQTSTHSTLFPVTLRFAGRFPLHSIRRLPPPTNRRNVPTRSHRSLPPTSSLRTHPQRRSNLSTPIFRRSIRYDQHQSKRYFHTNNISLFIAHHL